MKRLLILLFCIAEFICLSAQSKQSGYLFKKNQDAIIYYKDGRQFSVPLNYNLLTRQYVFIDKSDNNQQKEFTEPAMIVVIEIGKRTFLPPSEGATERIQAEPPFHVEYQGTSKRAGVSVGYGGTTETASASNYSGMRGNFIVGGVESDNKILTGIDKVYKVKVGKKMRLFFDKKKFLKLFASQKEPLEKYIIDNHIDFGVTEQVLGLYNYAVGLK